MADRHLTARSDRGGPTTGAAPAVCGPRRFALRWALLLSLTSLVSAEAVGADECDESVS